MAHSKTSRHKAVQWPIDPKGASSGKTKADAGKSAGDDKPAGRVEHDERGNAVWRKGSGDSTSTMLKKLEVPELKLEGQEDHRSAPLTPKPGAPTAKSSSPPPADPGGGYNPYDQGKMIRKPTAPRSPVGRKPR
jgi:hypothetical protein